MFKMFFGIYMIMVFDPQILFNDGFYDLIDVRIPEGSLLKPNFPAALSCRTHALGRIFDMLGGLLGQETPEFLNAAGFSVSPHFIYSGSNKKGEWFQLFQIGFGGIPGRPLGDGPDGHSLWPDFTNVPNEFLERYFPLRIERYETVPDSGGAGLHRGGNGITMSYRFLEAGEISIHDDRWFTYPWGVNGGAPGSARPRRSCARTARSENLPSKCDRIQVEPGDVLHFITWGGGGWGDPLKREAEKVAADVARGLVTVEGAKRYGVVLDADGKLDAAATERLRREMAGARAQARRRCSTAASNPSRNCATAAWRKRVSSRRRSRGSPSPIAPRRNRSGQDEQRANRSTGRQLRARRLSRLAGLGPPSGADPDRFRPGLLRSHRAVVRRRRLQDRARNPRCACARRRAPAACR